MYEPQKLKVNQMALLRKHEPMCVLNSEDLPKPQKPRPKAFTWSTGTLRFAGGVQRSVSTFIQKR